MFLSEHGQDGKCEPGNMAVQQQIGKEYRRGGSYGTDSDRRSGGAGGYFGAHLRVAVPEGPRRNAHAELPHLGAAGGTCAVCLGRISAGGPSAAEFKIKEKTKGGPNHALHCQPERRYEAMQYAAAAKAA